MRYTYLDIVMVLCVPTGIMAWCWWFYWYPFDALTYLVYGIFALVLWFQMKRL